MTWDARTVDWYARHFGEPATNRLAIEAIGPSLAADAVVIDIGCGTGCALRHALAHVTDGALIGVDATPRMVAIARERARPLEGAPWFAVGRAEALPLGDAVADAALAFDALAHWQEPARGLAEARRVVRPGGLLALVRDGALEDPEELLALPEALAAAGFVDVERRALGDGVEACTLWIAR